MIPSLSTVPASDLLKPGSKICWSYRLHHVVAIVIDEGETLFVLKYWIPRKQRWDYKVIWKCEYDFCRQEVVDAYTVELINEVCDRRAM